MTTETEISELDALARAEYAASNQCYKIQNERSARKRELEDQLLGPVKRQIEAILDGEFRERIEAAYAAQGEANAAWEAAKIRDAHSKTKYPVGTVLCQWTQYCGLSRLKAKWETAPQRGIVEIFKRGDGHANSSPSVGDPVLRILNKNGKPGKIIRAWRSYNSDFDGWAVVFTHRSCWRPEGINPNDEATSDE